MQWRVGRLGRNTVYTSVALGLRAAMQAGYLVLLSRSMGPNDYGLFAGSVAAAILLAPLSGWGIQYLLAERVGKDPASGRASWAGALVQTVSTGLLLGMLVLLVAFAMHDRLGLGAMAMLVVSELVLVPATQAASMLLLSLGRGAAGALVVCLVPAFRLVAVALLWAANRDMPPDAVAGMHVAGSIVGAALVLSIVRAIVGAAEWRERPPLRDMLRRGSRYAFGMLVGTSYTEVDKVLLLQLAGALMAGLYTAAFRVVAVLAIPVTALTSNALPRLFAVADTPDWRRVFGAVLLAGAGYGVAAALLAVGVAPFVPLVFGADYGESSNLVWMLAPWIVLYAAHQVLATGLTSLGRQGTRVAIEAGGFVAVVALNVALLPTLGARGAVYALLATEAAVTIACTGMLWRAAAPQPRPQTR